MTLLPVESIRVTVPERQEWPEAEEWHGGCSCPDCPNAGLQVHHVVRRSETAGPKRWVSVDGLVLLNERHVCLYCHDKLNNHEAWIRYLPGFGWVWYSAVPAAKAGVAAGAVDEYVQHPKSGRWFRSLGQLKGA